MYLFSTKFTPFNHFCPISPTANDGILKKWKIIWNIFHLFQPNSTHRRKKLQMWNRRDTNLTATERYIQKNKKKLYGTFNQHRIIRKTFIIMCLSLSFSRKSHMLFNLGCLCYRVLCLCVNEVLVHTIAL